MLKVESLVRNDVLDFESEDDVVRYVKEDIEAVQPVFDSYNTQAGINYDFYFGRQWTDEERDAHDTQKRIPYVFNEIKHKVDHIVGVQMQTRLDVKTVGREPADNMGAELLTFLLKWAAQVNDLEYTETEVFKDGLIGNVGWAAVYWENEDVLYGYPKVEIIPYNEIYYDVQSRKRDLSDARWIARRSQISRIEAKEKYPWLADKIEDIANGTYSGVKSYNVPTGRQRQTIHTTRPSFDIQDRELLTEIMHYERIKVNQYLVINDITGDIQTFDQRKEAEDYYFGLVDTYSEEGVSIIGDDGTAKVLFATDVKTQIIQTVLLQDCLIARELTILPDFPFVGFFPYFSHGEYQSFVEQLLSPQILVNRSFSQWDYILGASTKNLLTVMESLLRKGTTVETVRREASKTVPVLSVMSHDAIRSLPNNPVNPQIFQNIEFGITRMNDYAGGRNALGLTESAAESGRAVIARAEQGGVAKLPIFDALRFWRINISQRLVWYMKNFMSPKQIIRIVGEDKDVQYVNLDTSVLNTFKDIKTDIVVDEAIKSETMRERNFQQILQFSQIAQLPPEISMPIYLEYSTLPETKKEQILQQLEFYQSYIQQKAEAQKQEQMQQQVQDSLMKKQMKTSAEYGEEIAKSSDEIQRQEKELVSRIESLQEMKTKALQEAQQDQLTQQLLMQQQ